MRLTAIFAAFFVGSLFAASSVSAQDLESAKGEIHVAMNLAYAKVLVNGEDWEETEFRANGKTLVITGLDRNAAYDITLEASEDGYEKVEFRIDSKKRYKKKRKKRVISFVAKHKAVFRKMKADATQEKQKRRDEKIVPPGQDSTATKGLDKKTDAIIDAPSKEETLKQADPSKVRAPEKR